MDAVKASLKRLQMDYIDLYQIHHNDPVTPVEETAPRPGGPRAPGPGPLRRRLQLAGLEDHARRLGVAEHRGWARFETLQAYYSLVGRDLEQELAPLLTDGEDRPDGLFAPVERAAVGQVRPRRAQSRGPRRAKFDFPPVDRDQAWACVAEMRADRRGAGLHRGPCRHRLALGQAGGVERHHRREADGPAGGQSRRGGSDADGGGDGGAGRGERAAAGLPYLDAGPNGTSAGPGAVRTEA